MVAKTLNSSAEDNSNTPLEYPWNPPEASGLMSGQDFFLFELAELRRLGQSHVKVPNERHLGETESINHYLLESNAVTIDARFLVVAVGSNASPSVMRKKFLNGTKSISLVLPFVRGTIHGIDVGHSAHASAGGYIAAAPYANPDQERELWASWLDADQLKVLDDTEPNYQRVLVQNSDYPFKLENGETPESYYIYESKRGLIAEAGVTQPLMSQTDLFDWLRGRTELSAIVDEDDPERIAQSFTDATVRSAFIKCLENRQLVQYSGIKGTRSSPLKDHRYGETPSILVENTSSKLRIEASADNLSREGQQCVALNKEDLRISGVGTHAIARAFIPPNIRDGSVNIDFSSRPGLVVRVIEGIDVAPGSIQADQVVRNALGVEKQEHLTLQICEAPSAVLGNALLGGANYVACRVQAADLSSVEQEVCLLEPLAMRFLGINQGDLIVIEGVPLDGEIAVTRIRLRACEIDADAGIRRVSLSGGGLEMRFPDPSDALGVSPDLPRIFLDAAARAQLGLGKHKLTVVRIRPSRSFQLKTQMRELLLILVLAFIGLISLFRDPLMVGILLVGLIAIAVLVVHSRLRSQLGLRRNTARIQSWRNRTVARSGRTRWK